MDKNIERLYELFQKHPSVSTDSRNIKHGSIFFALKGENFNGNDFAEIALKKGAVASVVDEINTQPSDRIIQVHDSLKALQDLAKLHRSKLESRVIGITGSNGKTTTKELIFRVLNQKYSVIATQGNLNNHIGVPLTILSIPEDTDFAVIEMGANKIGEIAGLSEIARPGFGIITNVGRAHLEGFGSFKGVIQGKTELYDFIRKTAGTLFINADNDILKKAAVGITTVCYGKDKEVNCRGKIKNVYPFLSVDCRLGKENTFIQTNLIGKYNFENILAAVCIGMYFDVPVPEIKKAIELYKPTNNRSQIVQTQHNLLILDAYNANPSSMKEALVNFDESPDENKIVILGDMFELGNDSVAEHKEIVRLVSAFKFDQVLLVGPNFISADSKKQYLNFGSTNDLITYLKKNPIEGQTILIKGSRKMQLETVSEML